MEEEELHQQVLLKRCTYDYPMLTDGLCNILIIFP